MFRMSQAALFPALVLLLRPPVAFGADGAHVDHKGRVRMLRAGSEFHEITTELVVAAPKWSRQYRQGEASNVRHETRGGRQRWTGEIPAGQGGAIAYEQELIEAGGEVRLSCRVRARGDVEAAGVFLFVHVPVRLFAGGRCELLGADANSKPAATMPAKLPEKHHFLDGRASGLTLTDRRGTTRLKIALDRPLPLTLQDGRKWKGDHYDAYFGLLHGRLRDGQSAELAVRLKLTAPQDRRAARLTLNAARRRYRLDGFGGNFCYGVDSPVTRYNLANIQLAWARVGVKLDQWEPTNDNGSPDEIDWKFFGRRDRPGSELRADFLTAQRLARMNVPYIASAWRVPEFVTAQPGRGWQARKRKLPKAKWPEVMECIGSYLLYIKREYDTEPVMFSFNESDIGCFILMTPEEHRDWIKACGAYLAGLGLKTKMLLGDCTKRGNTAFIEPAAGDAEAMKHVAAVAFHTWSKRPEHYRAWREVARRLKLPLIAAEVGPDAAAWKDRSFNLLHYFVREMRMYQELLLHADLQAVLEWEYTADYRMVEVEKQDGGKEAIRPTPRFWMIRQFANTTPRPATALETKSDHDKVLFTAFTGAKPGGGGLVLHVANVGAPRKAAITGLPGNVGRLQAVRTSWDKGSEELSPVDVRTGKAELDLAQFSLLTLTTEDRARKEHVGKMNEKHTVPSQAAQGMFYKARAKETGNMWDTWLYLHEGTHYLYYLAKSGRQWDNISVATSPDGVHWTEHGRVLSKGKGVKWMGTGSTWKSPNFEKDGKFFMNFSEWKGPRQTILFAESTDLLHWKRLGGDCEFKQDERWYQPNGRWDCIWTIPRPGGGLYGYWTATPKRETGGGFGFGETLDGVRWRALEPPKIHGARGGEVGAVEKIGRRYYMMYGRYPVMMTLVADKPEGPFHAAKTNFRLLAGHTYFSRFYPSPDGVLVNHHSIARGGQVYFAPLKKAVLDEAGTLRLGWWKGNEKLKHEAVEVKPPPATDKPAGRAAILATTFDVEQGLILEGTLTLPEKKGSPRRGLYVECGKDQGSAILINAAGLAELGPMNADGTGFKAEKRIDRQMPFRRPAAFRLLLKQSLLEFYLDDILIECFSLPASATGRIGLIPAASKDAFGTLKAWR